MSYITKFKLSLNTLSWVGLYPISIQNDAVITKPFNIVYQLGLLLLSTVCFIITAYAFIGAMDISRSVSLLFGFFQYILCMSGSITTIFSCFLTTTNHLYFLNSLTVIDTKIIKELNCSNIDSNGFFYKCFVKDVLAILSGVMIILVYFYLCSYEFFNNWYDKLININVTFVSLIVTILSLHIQNCARILTKRNEIVRKYLQELSVKRSVLFKAALNIVNDLWQIQILFEKSFKIVIFLIISTDFINSTVLLYFMFTAFLYEYNGDNMFQNWLPFLWSVPMCLYPFTVKTVLLAAALDNLSQEVGAQL